MDFCPHPHTAAKQRGGMSNSKGIIGFYKTPNTLGEYGTLGDLDKIDNVIYGLRESRSNANKEDRKKIRQALVAARYQKKLSNEAKE